MESKVTWRRLPVFGAFVDVDLSKPLSRTNRELLRVLYDEHHLLLFTGQSLSYDDQVRIAGWFGPVRAVKSPHYISTDPDVGGLGNEELPFHSDLSCSPYPLLGLSLYAVEVGADASPTIFIDAMRAAATLPEALRNRLDGLHSMNLWPRILSKRQRSGDAPEGWPGTAHPLLKPHPRSGEPILYLNASHTDRIVELVPEAGEALIQQLFDWLYAPANRYEHRWRKGDLIVWDNLALQHGRPPIAAAAVRTLQRVSIGTHTYDDVMPPELMSA